MTPAKTPAPEGGEGETHAHEFMNVYQRFSMACRIIGSQAWVKSMDNSQFKSIPIDAMRKGVREACVQAGIVHVGPVGLTYERITQDRTTKWVGTCRFKYINIDDPSEVIEYESLGEAMDNGDKGAGKLITNLIKNHYKSAFDIGEQGRDDVDSYSNEAIYDEADRIASKRQSVRDKAKADPFFSGSKRVKSDGPADRPMSVLIESLTRWTDIEPAHSIISACKAAYGPHIDKWGAEEIRSTYLRCVNEFKANGGIPE